MVDNGLENELKEYSKKINVTRSGYHSDIYEGNECLKILQNTDKLQVMLSDKHKVYTETLDSLRLIDESVSGKTLNDRYETSISQFAKNVEVLRKNFKFKLTPKIHIICDHLKDYLSSTGQPLGITTDQLVENMHQHVDKTFRKSGYFVKDIHSDAHDRKLLKGTIHLNTYNL